MIVTVEVFAYFWPDSVCPDNSEWNFTVCKNDEIMTIHVKPNLTFKNLTYFRIICYVYALLCFKKEFALSCMLIIL